MKMFLTASACLTLAGAAHAVSVGQVDDFEDGTTAGWLEGGVSPNPPFTVSEGGDTFLRNVAAGGFGAGGRQIMFNVAQWTGDFLGAGVTSVSMDVRNSGNFDITLRLAFQSFTAGRSSTNDGFLLEAGGDWQTVTFDLTDQTVLKNAPDLASILQNVQQMRILAAMEPDYRGDPIPSTLDVDNIRALPAPGAAALFGLAGLAACRRRR